jgi:hypothetical protein
MTNHLQSKFTIIRPKNYKKSLLCGLLISQTSAEMPPKNGGVRKANWIEFYAWQLFKSFWYHSAYEYDVLINLTSCRSNWLAIWPFLCSHSPFIILELAILNYQEKKILYFTRIELFVF